MSTTFLLKAATLLAHLRRAGVLLTAKGDRLAFDAPAGAMTPEVVAMLKARKPELLAVLRGDYLHAAAALVLSIPDSRQRAALAHLFDERTGICQYDGNMSRGEAERAAYRDLARTVSDPTHNAGRTSIHARDSGTHEHSSTWS